VSPPVRGVQEGETATLPAAVSRSRSGDEVPTAAVGFPCRSRPGPSPVVACDRIVPPRRVGGEVAAAQGEQAGAGSPIHSASRASSPRSGARTAWAVAAARAWSES